MNHTHTHANVVATLECDGEVCGLTQLVHICVLVSGVLLLWSVINRLALDVLTGLDALSVCAVRDHRIEIDNDMTRAFKLIHFYPLACAHTG